MSFVNDQGDEDVSQGELPGLELPETPEPIVPASRREPREPEPSVAYGQRIAKKPLKRLFLGQTAVDFWGRRNWGLALSAVLIVVSVISLSTRWLNLGIDFEGGVAYDVPASELSTDDIRDVLDDNGVDGTHAKVEERSSSSGDIVKVQIGDEPEEVRVAIQEALAEAAGVDPAEVSVASVSSSWGEQITRKAIIALAVFLGLIAVVIAIRFEWRMAIAAIVAMLHDVVVSAGIYSIFGFEVTPPTVIAFLTILGYSLYDTIVVFDRVKENERRVAAAGLSAADLVNVSANQVLMRSLNTSISAVLPVIALLVIGSGLLGQITLREFAIALLIGMLTGAYSSIFIATPLLGMLKRSMRPAAVRPGEVDHLTGDELRSVVVRGVGVLAPRTTRRRGGGAGRTGAGRSAGSRAPVEPGADTAPGDTLVAERPQSALLPPDATTEQLLGRAARPRKKKRH
jgi:preprotein translocase subunit SecF